MIFQNCLKITYNNFEISLVVFMPNITTNHAITYTNLAFNFILYFITSLTLPYSGLLLNRYLKSNLNCILVYLSVLDHFWPVWALSRQHEKQDDLSDISLIRIVLSRTKTSTATSSIFCYDDGLSFISVKYSDKWCPLKCLQSTPFTFPFTFPRYFPFKLE